MPFYVITCLKNIDITVNCYFILLSNFDFLVQNLVHRNLLELTNIIL